MIDNTHSRNAEDGVKISIIIATLNSGASLQKCIDSVISQSHCNRELIIVDGGSSDGTVEILKKNAEAIEYWESTPDHGIYDAWNKGLSHASGDWVCFLGSDDFLAHRDVLRHLVANPSPDVTLVTGLALIQDSSGRQMRYFGGPWNWNKMKHSQCVAHSGAIVKRNEFARVGQFDSSFRIAGDYDFLLRLGRSINARFIDETVVVMTEGGQSRSRCYAVSREKWKIQSRHPEIGILLASIYFLYSFVHCIFSKVRLRVLGV